MSIKMCKISTHQSIIHANSYEFSKCVSNKWCPIFPLRLVARVFLELLPEYINNNS